MVDENNVWIQRRKNWKPVEIPKGWWEQCPDLHDMWREMYPDLRRMPVVDGEKEEEAPKLEGGSSSSSVPKMIPPKTVATEEGDGVAEGGLFNAGPDDDVPDKVDPTRTKNYWQETPTHFIFWKVTQSMGDVKPYVQGPPNAPEVGVLQGSRRHEATFGDDSTVVIEDYHDCKRSYPEGSKEDWSRLQSERWTGRVAFRKMRISKGSADVVIPAGSQWEPLPGTGDSNVAVLGEGKPHHNPKLLAQRTRGRMTINQLKASRKEEPMSDNLIQPCLEEADRWPGLYEKIERERSYFEEITHFEEAANRRMMYVQKNPSARGAQVAEQA
ncbi:MAG: hypothetical protein QF745_04295, partial [Planctomycetota bacterium]|nr:hypothetical protein [Planctomycetota bacterium]